MILSIFIVTIGLLIYRVQAHEHAKWVKMQKGLAEIEIKKQKYLRELYEIRANSEGDINEELPKIQALFGKYESMNGCGK